MRWEGTSFNTDFLPPPPVEAQWTGWLISAFNTLSRSRSFSVGMSVLLNPISFTEIYSYIKCFLIPESDISMFINVIQALDDEYRAYYDKKLNKKVKKK